MVPEVPKPEPEWEEGDNRRRAVTPLKGIVHGRQIGLEAVAPPPQVLYFPQSPPRRWVQWKVQQWEVDK